MIKKKLNWHHNQHFGSVVITAWQSYINVKGDCFFSLSHLGLLNEIYCRNACLKLYSIECLKRMLVVSPNMSIKSAGVRRNATAGVYIRSHWSLGSKKGTRYNKSSFWVCSNILIGSILTICAVVVYIQCWQ